MKVFISWSGNNSKKLAESLRGWLPSVLQAVKPYFTPSDIEKGARWNTDIVKELESSQVGILCVTRDNLHSDWVMFEAGALSRSLENACVCPVLFGIHNTDLAGPLKQFQTTEFEKDDFRKLVSVINAKLGDQKLQAKTLDSVFDKWWPELQSEISQILEKFDDVDAEPVRSDRDILEEILGLTRIRRVPPMSSGAMNDLLGKYIALHNDEVAGRGGHQETLDSLQSMKKAIQFLTRRALRNPVLDEMLEKLDDLTFKHEKEITDDEVPF